MYGQGSHCEPLVKLIERGANGLPAASRRACRLRAPGFRVRVPEARSLKAAGG